jgi:hypothetical protein
MCGADRKFLSVLGSDFLSTNLPPFRVKTSPTIHVRRAAMNTDPHVIFMRPVRSDNKGGY